MIFIPTGRYLNCWKKGQQSFVDANGRTSIEFGTYEEINFASNGLIRVKNKNKYGFVDRKLNVAIPYKYAKAGDFKDSCALVQLKDKFILINTQGNEVYSSSSEIQKISRRFYLVKGENENLINNLGELVFGDISSIQQVNGKLFIITLNNGVIKLLSD